MPVLSLASYFVSICIYIHSHQLQNDYVQFMVLALKEIKTYLFILYR